MAARPNEKKTFFYRLCNTAAANFGEPAPPQVEASLTHPHSRTGSICRLHICRPPCTPPGCCAQPVDACTVHAMPTCSPLGLAADVFSAAAALSLSDDLSVRPETTVIGWGLKQLNGFTVVAIGVELHRQHMAA
eukprot:357020-Chlamydomonas_euryale.AAC.2